MVGRILKKLDEGGSSDVNCTRVSMGAATVVRAIQALNKRILGSKNASELQRVASQGTRRGNFGFPRLLRFSKFLTYNDTKILKVEVGTSRASGLQ